MSTLLHVQSLLAKLPDVPGVYLFYNSNKELIYVGKATSLKSRVRSYWSGKKTPRPIEEMLHEVVDVSWRETDSVLEAIILEAALIKKNQPRYNVLGKDDKSWNYIVITRELFPTVRTVRQHDLALLAQTTGEANPFLEVFGPFPGLNTKEALKILRKLFRFSTCKPAHKPCLYYQLGQCLGVCTGEIAPSDYRRLVVRPLVLFLRGEKKRVVVAFQKSMALAATEKRFEEAARLRDQIRALDRIRDVTLLNESFVRDVLRPEHQPGDFMARRIEGYDISNLGATGIVGSMVVFDDTEPVKREYRKFSVRHIGQSDVDSLAEVLERRLNHPEWPLPDVFLVDGGLPQLNRARSVLTNRGIKVPLVGIAKGSERKRNDFLVTDNSKPFLDWLGSHRVLLIRVRDEAHRFAITFQRSKRKLPRGKKNKKRVY